MKGKCERGNLKGETVGPEIDSDSRGQREGHLSNW